MIIQVSVVSFAILVAVYLLILWSDRKNTFNKNVPSTGGVKPEAGAIEANSTDDSCDGVSHLHPSSSHVPERIRHISIDNKKETGPGVEDLAALFGFRGMTKPLEKTLSVVRIDISNLSRLKTDLSPRSFFTMMDLFYTQLITAAETFQGEINHFDGHWALLAFGRILILDDHKASALNAANAIATLISDIEEQYLARAMEDPHSDSGLSSNDEYSPYIPIEVKVAVATGTVIAGPLGKDIRQIFTLFGGPVDKVEDLIKTATTGAVVTD